MLHRFYIFMIRLGVENNNYTISGQRSFRIQIQFFENLSGTKKTFKLLHIRQANSKNWEDKKTLKRAQMIEQTKREKRKKSHR